MLYIYSGPDDYTKKIRVERLVTGLSLSVVVFSEQGEAPTVENIVSGDLFGGDKIFLLYNHLNAFAATDVLNTLKASRNHIVFLETTLDKRLTSTKSLLKDSEITFVEFPLPEGRALISWVVERTREQGSSMTESVATVLLARLGIAVDNQRSFGAEQKVSLWQIDSELAKVTTYANEGPITSDMIAALIPEAGEVSGFDIINALADKNKSKVFSLCEKFFNESTNSDEKAKFILLNSLLADQFRSILMVQGFLESQASETEVLAKTGWKPGRLFVLKKIAGKFSQSKVVETLSKLESFDVELKSASTPPHVLIDLILAQVV